LTDTPGVGEEVKKPRGLKKAKSHHLLGWKAN